MADELNRISHEKKLHRHVRDNIALTRTDIRDDSRDSSLATGKSYLPRVREGERVATAARRHQGACDRCHPVDDSETSREGTSNDRVPLFC